MTDKTLQQIAEELAEIKLMLAAVLNQQQISEELSETRSEMAEIDARGIDTTEYLKSRAAATMKSASRRLNNGRKTKGVRRSVKSSGSAGKERDGQLGR